MCTKNTLLAVLALLFLSITPLSSQTPTASFATWKDNKKAAYAIIHDDYASYTPSIFTIADPLATARGIKLCIATITSGCGATEWANMKTMMGHGHEIVNHSHNHKCGGLPTNCIGVTSYDSTQFSVELSQSTQLIETNTGVRPLFFCHPYDAWSTPVLNYLKNNLSYLGSRSGISGNINPSNFSNFMQTDFCAYNGTTSGFQGIQSTLAATITQGGYMVSEFHGVADASAGPIPLADYTTHLDYVKTKMNDGSLWSATTSEVITYKMQRDAYTISTAYMAATNTINVNFTNIIPLNTTILKTPVTVNVNVGTITGTFAVSQGSTTIPSTRNGNIISFNVYPHQGNLSLQTNTLPAEITNFLASPQTSAVALSWVKPTSNFDEVMIVAKANTAFTTKPKGLVYTANANFLGAGTAFEGGKVVYRGTGTNVIVTNLTNGTLYHFKAFSRFGTEWSNGVATTAKPFVVTTTLPVSFATWKDNKKAAYTIIHDDYASYTPSIFTIADPLATARGIKICAAAITSGCGTAEWTNMKTMISHGHEIVNHSHNHRCGGPLSECTGVLSYDSTQFSVELSQSTQLIQTNTGVRPLFFCHPYDAWSTSVLNYLKNNLGYLGSRSGISGNTNPSSFSNFMQIDFCAYNGTTPSFAAMQSTLEATIARGDYMVGEFHGVADASAGPIPLADYTTHLDYVKAKMTDGSLWSATASEAITYKMQRDAYTIKAIYTPSMGVINVNFTNIKTLNTYVLKTPVTVNVNLGSIGSSFIVSQGATIINSTRNGNIISFNVYPYKGNVVLNIGTPLTRILNDSANEPELSVAEPILDNPFNSKNSVDYTLSPNPTNGILNIDLPSAEGQKVELALITRFGKIVKQETIEFLETPRYTWNLNNIDNGQYFIRIQTQGKNTVMKKLIVLK